MNIVLDSNIYVAAFLSKGLASDIVKYAEKGKVNIFASVKILAEVKSTLVGKFKLDNTYAEAYVRHIRESVSIVRPLCKIDVLKTDPDDKKILECAVEAEANLIVSIDKHLLKLKKYKGIGIVHPKTLTWIIPKLLK